jgi:hypothetical protein
MSKRFKRGDHVESNSEASRVRGTVVKNVVSDVLARDNSSDPENADPHGRTYIKDRTNIPIRAEERLVWSLRFVQVLENNWECREL